MQVGIVGLPNVGKSTLFNALTSDNVGAENYPFCTIDPNIGVVEVPDRRLQKLNEMYQPEKLTPTTIEFVDIAGLVKGASQGEGLGNQFLAHIREVDAIAHVIRCFKGSDVAHVSGEINPLEDIKVLNTELMLADLATLEKRKNKTEKMLKTGEEIYKEEMEVLKRLIKKLNKEINVRELKLNNFEKKVVNELNLLTAKPVIYIANVGEEQLKGRNKYLEKVKKYTTKKGIPGIAVSAKLEEEIAGLPSEEKEIFLEEFGLKESGLNKFIKASYKLLNLITFFTTAGGKEVRATTISKGTKAPKAAGKIHSDMEKGFIKAEVINFQKLNKIGSVSSAREKGLLRLEGKDYEVQDGDVIYFHFNV